MSRTSLERNRWQLSRVILTACLPSLIHCSAVPRLLWNRTTARLSVSRLVTMNPTRGNSSPKWNSTFATTRRAVFQLAAWYRNSLYQNTGLWLGLPTGRVSSSAVSRAVVGWDADSVLHAAFLQRFIDLRLGEGRIGPEQ